MKSLCALIVFQVIDKKNSAKLAMVFCMIDVENSKFQAFLGEYLDESIIEELAKKAGLETKEEFL